jgi:uncharacterized protein with FMN-binding domain
MARFGFGKSATGKKSSGKKVANGLVAVSSAAVLAVYAAGYTRTQAAAEKLDGQGAERRPSGPRPARIQSPAAEFPSVASLPVAALPVTAREGNKPLLIATAEPAPGKASLPEKSTSATSAPAVDPAPVAVTAKSLSPVPAAASAPTPAPVPVTTVAAPAPAPDAGYKAIVAAALPPWKDGTYDGWGTCRHGDLQATVVVEGGKITSASISQCLTRYSCDIIDKLPPQVIQRQSPDVSYVSGATQSTDAYYWAIVSALGKAK